MKQIVLLFCVILAGCDTPNAPSTDVEEIVATDWDSEANRPKGDAKDWACSNHDPQHFASAREIPGVTTQYQCKNWRRVRQN